MGIQNLSFTIKIHFHLQCLLMQAQIGQIDKNHIQPIDKNQSKDEIIVSSKSGTVNVSNSNKVAQDVSKVTSDFNGDGYEDQAIGAHEDVGNVGNAGAVHIIYGSPDGLSSTAALPDQLWTQESAFIQGSAELRDHFGAALAPGGLQW